MNVLNAILDLFRPASWRKSWRIVKRRQAANALLDVYFAHVTNQMEEGFSKTDEDLVVEEFLWRCYGAHEMADVLAVARAGPTVDGGTIKPITYYMCTPEGD